MTAAEIIRQAEALFENSAKSRFIGGPNFHAKLLQHVIWVQP